MEKEERNGESAAKASTAVPAARSLSRRNSPPHSQHHKHWMCRAQDLAQWAHERLKLPNVISVWIHVVFRERGENHANVWIDYELFWISDDMK